MPLVAILVGCKGKAACKADVDELMTFFRAMDHSMPLYFDGDGIKLVERTDLPRHQPSPTAVIVIGKTIRWQGGEVSLDKLGDRLADYRAWVMKSPRRGNPSEINLAIDVNAAWGDVVSVADVAFRSGFTHPAFGFGVPVTVKPPPRVAVDDELDKIKKEDAGGNRAVELANLMSDIVKSCKPLKKSFGAVGADEGGDKAQMLIDEMGPALLECNCDVDIPALRNVFFAVANNPHPATVIHVDLAKGGKAIALPAATPWSEAQKQLADGAVVTLQVLHD